MSFDRNTPVPDLPKYLPRVWDLIPYIRISVGGLTGRSGQYPVVNINISHRLKWKLLSTQSCGLCDGSSRGHSFLPLDCYVSPLCSFLPAVFFFVLLLLSHPCQKLFVSVGIVHACVHHTRWHKFLLMWTHFHLMWHPKHLAELSITETNPRIGSGDRE